MTEPGAGLRSQGATLGDEDASECLVKKYRELCFINIAKFTVAKLLEVKVENLIKILIFSCRCNANFMRNAGRPHRCNGSQAITK